ncbi:MAG: type II secretion system F family protein [Candidatus Omnitrophota bacterium]
MLALALFLVLAMGMLLVFGYKMDVMTSRPTLKVHDFGVISSMQTKQKEARRITIFSIFRGLAVFNKPFITTEIRRNMMKSLSISHTGILPEEFLLIKEVVFAFFFFVTLTFFSKELFAFGVLLSVGMGYYAPEFWLRSKISAVKDSVIRQLPDTVDLLGLCVNAGLDFMMALKWVVEKSSASHLISEMNNVLQEINVGKPRRDALRDLAKRYEIPDLSTFSRTLIQADKMGTSVSEALNILSEDMRLARFRRGEALALKAPLKMLAPLLFCIFPVVGILVAAPIFLDFMYNNPMKSLAGGH